MINIIDLLLKIYNVDEILKLIYLYFSDNEFYTKQVKIYDIISNQLNIDY